MLINLSNHPSGKWSKEQFMAAKPYTEIVDWPFPAIDPETDTKSIEKLAQQYFTAILEEINSSDDSQNAVHVMGEMTFSFALVALLQKEGVRCVASTSKRMVVEQQGQKIVTFNFVQFRGYPQLSHPCK